MSPRIKIRTVLYLVGGVLFALAVKLVTMPPSSLRDVGLSDGAFQLTLLFSAVIGTVLIAATAFSSVVIGIRGIIRKEPLSDHMPAIIFGLASGSIVLPFGLYLIVFGGLGAWG